MTEVNAVSLKLPIFYTSPPEVWFFQAEAQFAPGGITADETKYYYVIATHDQPTVTRLLDLISRPPTDDKHGALKTRLTDTFGLSKQERASSLLHFRPLGDSKPSTRSHFKLYFWFWPGDPPATRGRAGGTSTTQLAMKTEVFVRINKHSTPFRSKTKHLKVKHKYKMNTKYGLGSTKWSWKYKNGIGSTNVL